MENNSFLRLFCTILCLSLLLSSCASAKTGNDAPSASTDALSEDSSSTESMPSEPENVNRYDDLLSKMTDCGKSVVTYGDLKADEYSASVQSLEKILDGYKHNISIVAYSLDNNKALAYNTKTDLFCACTVKAAYSLYACKQMENGNGSLDTVMTYEKKHYEPGTGDMQYSAFGTKFTMKTIIDKSMRISDNVGYLMSVDYFGRDGYNKWIKKLGCESLQIKPTVWSLHAKAKDLAVVWREIYNYFETDTEYSKFLYNSCTGTPNNYATAALKGVKYSHKQGNNRSGDWLAYSDAGIVWKEGNPYIIVILTDAPGPSSYDASIFADIINIVHNYLF